jgi:hypothetical protein
MPLSRHYVIFASGQDAYQIKAMLAAVLDKLGVEQGELSRLLQMETAIMADLTSLTAQAEATEGTIDSAVVVINGIAARIAEAGVDPVKLQAIQDGLKGRADALAFAIAADAAGPAPVVAPSVPN